MRNPWGSEKYTGPWNDDDNTRWTPEFDKQAGHVKGDDGTFFVPVSVFRAGFPSYTVAMYQKWLTTTAPI